MTHRHPDVAELVAALLGIWTGAGEGMYATIEPFRYRERLEVTERLDHPALHYDQRAWKHTHDGEVVSHWETGLIRISSEGWVRVFNAQGGRSEALTGSWERQGQTWALQLQSHQYAGDDRVLRSVRELRVGNDSLAYEMSMETTATHEMGPHLRAELVREA